MEIKGIDVSYCQEGMNFAKAAQTGVKFCLIRGGFSTKEDVVAASNIKGCKSNGIDIGYYWYSYAKTIEDAKAEANACIKFLNKQELPTYPVFYDIEEAGIAKAVGKKVLTDIACTFMDMIQQAGYPTGLYANPAFLESYLDKSRIVGKYDIWLAHWTENPSVKSRYNYGQKVWQWGLDKTINGGVDGDICFVNYPSITKEFYKNKGVVSVNSKKTVDNVATEIIANIEKTSEYAKLALKGAGYTDNEIAQVEKKVKDKFMITVNNTATKKSVEEIADEVWAGKWGNGDERKRRLQEAGYDYNAVQTAINNKYY